MVGVAAVAREPVRVRRRRSRCRSGRTGAGSGRARRDRRPCVFAAVATPRLANMSVSVCWCWPTQSRIGLSSPSHGPSSPSSGRRPSRTCRVAGQARLGDVDERVEVDEEAPQVGRQVADVLERRAEVVQRRAQVADQRAACRERTRSAAGTCAATRPGRSGRSATCRANASRWRWIAVKIVSVFSTSARSWSSRSVSAPNTTPVFFTSPRSAARWRVEDLEQVAALFDEPGQVAERVVEVAARGRDPPSPSALLPRAERLARVGIECVEDLVELDRVGDLRGWPGARPRRASGASREPSRQLDVGLAQQRLLAQRRARVACAIGA